jgi:PAS domain S-box-containing protein
VKTAFLDKLIDRLDRIDPASLQGFVLKLSREKGFLETLFNTIQEGILVTDAEGRLRYLNAAAAELLGLHPDRAIGEPISRQLRDLDWDKIWSADKQEWSKVLAHEIEVFSPRHRFLSFYIVPMVDQENSLVTGLALILRDVTEQRHRTASAIESEKLSALTLLAAGVAHEIGNPLNSLNIHLQLIERELNDLPPERRNALRELLAVSKNEVSRLDRIITQFLRAIRPAQIRRERARVQDVLKETLEFLQHEIKDRDVLVDVTGAEDLPAAPIDRGQVRQAFFNVIRNAIQAMANGGVLRISLAATDRHVVASFKDSGPGIPAEDLSGIFEPYHTTKPEGSGLGLVIVQRIVRDHGGQIEVHSEPRVGTTVTIFLPRDEQRIRLLKAHRPPAAARAGSKDES